MNATDAPSSSLCSNAETVYDEQIRPLLRKAAEIAKANGMSTAYTTQISEDDVAFVGKCDFENAPLNVRLAAMSGGMSQPSVRLYHEIKSALGR